jgi:ABC-2 type transport system ATP-binding protein
MMVNLLLKFLSIVLYHSQIRKVNCFSIAFFAKSCYNHKKTAKEGVHMLNIEHLTKLYGEKKAVDDLSLTIAPGEIYGFIGHNGAGKTTTIKACCGILQCERGSVTVGGLSMKEQPIACKSMMAYIPDNPDLYDFLTGIKYLHFVADVYGVPADLRAERIRTYADRFALTKDLGAPISSYSHGMKQKLAIIAAWLHAPRLIIMDEPFVGLDPHAAHILKGMMREHCDAGGAIFFSTHVLEVAEKLCDKVAIIQHGKLIASGRMDEVRGDQSLESVFLELAEQGTAGGEG